MCQRVSFPFNRAFNGRSFISLPRKVSAAHLYRLSFSFKFRTFSSRPAGSRLFSSSPCLRWGRKRCGTFLRSELDLRSPGGSGNVESLLGWLSGGIFPILQTLALIQNYWASGKRGHSGLSGRHAMRPSENVLYWLAFSRRELLWP